MSGVSASAARLPETAPLASRSGSLLGIRIPLLALGALALLAGLCAGLWRLGWAVPHGSFLGAIHGPLLISGFFGTLISLERAVALGRGWAYAAPALAGLGTLALLAGAPAPIAAGLYALASAGLVAASFTISVKEPALFTGAILLGALTWLAGNVLWLLGQSVPELAGWWLAFLILTISGERLELSRLLAPRRGSEAVFLFAVGLLLVGAQNGILNENGAILYGLGLVSMTAWLLRHDIAQRSVRQSGQTRFFAACMLLGYLWLGLAGAMLLVVRPGEAPFGYDLVLHAIVIGFVLSMVFGHALIILPAVTRLRVAYRPLMYAPLAVLHASLLLRTCGDLLEWEAVRQWSGIATILALVGFAMLVATSARHARRNTASAARAMHR
jgi:hypothetical protein